MPRFSSNHGDLSIKLQMWRERVSSLSSNAALFPRNLRLLFVASIEGYFLCKILSRNANLSYLFGKFNSQVELEDSQEFEKVPTTLRAQKATSICPISFPKVLRVTTDQGGKEEEEVLRIG